MLSNPLGISASSTLINTTKIPLFNTSFRKPINKVSPPSNEFSLLSLTISGRICRASQVVDTNFPSTTVCPEIIVRKARLEDYWEVAEIHCNSFFPDYSFPLYFLWRIDRLFVAMLAAILAGLSRPSGCRRIYLVAIIGSSSSLDDKNSLFGKFSLLGKGCVAGILTVDNNADFLPRKGPRRRRRTGIAYISNVAVREKFQRKGIAKKLVAMAESQAKSWGCHAIALHCDMNNSIATMLYEGQGFKCIKVPHGAKWPQPKASPDVKFNFMMKLV